MKFLVVIIGLVLMLIAGYYSYLFLSKKIRQSESLIGILLYALALLAALGSVYFGGLFVITKVYALLVNSE